MRDDGAPVPTASDAPGPLKRGGRGGRRPNGTGSLRPVQGRANSWRAEMTVRGRVFSATSDRPEAAWQRLHDKIAQGGRRLPGAPDPARVTVAEYARAWLARREVEVGRGLEPTSWRRHEQALNLHLLPAVGDLPLAGLTAADLEALYARLLGPPAGLAVETVRKVNGTLRLALKRLPRDFGLPNPALDVELPRRERVTVQYPLRPDQMRRLWAAAAAVDDRLAALWRLAAHVPSRSGELRALKWTDWDEAHGVLLLQRSLRGAADAGRTLDEKAPKTAANRRVLELGPALAAALRAHRARQAAERRAAGGAWVDHGLIFCTRAGTPFGKGNLLRAFRRLLRLAGLPEHHRVHDLRHTAVQNLLLSGASLPEASGAAGHASPAVTSALYAHAVRRVRAELLGRLGAFYEATGATGGDAAAPAGSLPPVPPVLPPDGQPRALTPRQVEEAQRRRAGGATQAELAARYGVSPSTINRALRGVTGRRLGQNPARGAAPDTAAASGAGWFTERADAAESPPADGSAGTNPAQISPERGIRTRMTAPHDGAAIWGEGGSAYGIRTRGLRLERAVS